MSEYGGPQLGGEVIINAPRRECHGKIGTVVSLHLATNEATVQVAGGRRYIIDSEDAPIGRPTHGTRARYKGAPMRPACHCLECSDAESIYQRARRARNRKAS